MDYSKKPIIGIVYSNNENWIGGTYYIQNLVLALNRLNDIDKPELTIFCDTKAEFNQIKQSNYPYLKWQKLQLKTIPLPLFKKILNKIFNLFAKKQFFSTGYELVNTKVNYMFPGIIGLKNVKNIFWIPDFQEQKLPHFFSKKEIEYRNQSHYFIAKSQQTVVFSSNNALQHFNELFPLFKGKKKVINFAVTHPLFQQLDLNELQEKYNLLQPYFISPNQFWKHKNQIIILKAIKELLNKGVTNFTVAFTGKELDSRNPNYFKSLTSFVVDNNLQNNVRFLGFIDRCEQLKLMSGALCIIQPSLFEGWSTVVEDAKAINQFIIASNIAVHKEQLQNNVSFFNPENEQELAQKMLNILQSNPKTIKIAYEQNIKKYAQSFIEIVTEK